MIPGEYKLQGEKIICNKGKDATLVRVVNTGDRSVQVGSHYHFFEVNKVLNFDRDKSYGKRLDIASGTAVRFEPGDEKEVRIIDIAGKRLVYGLNDKVNGALD